MNFLKRIDWVHDDGVNLSMINDFMRNQFYDRVLKRYVHDQYCTDIGFGTGLLSILALKHGARHIRAFESDTNRYKLGVAVIDQLGLQKQIELINDRYTRDRYDATPVTFTETVNGTLWGEGVWHSLPRAGSKEIFLPGTYFLEIWAVEIPEAFAQGLCRVGQTQRYFAPGIDLPQNFVQLINSLLGKIGHVHNQDLPQGIVNFARQQETDWGWIPYMRAVQHGNIVGSYSADIWESNKTNFTIQIPTTHWQDSTVLIVPRMGMQQDRDRLYLDTGSWGPGEDPVLLVRPEKDLLITHNIQSSRITYSMEI